MYINFSKRMDLGRVCAFKQEKFQMPESRLATFLGNQWKEIWVHNAKRPQKSYGRFVSF